MVLTDGDIFGDPLNLTTVINSSKMQGVVRFAIGVSAKSREANLTLYRLGKGAAQWKLLEAVYLNPLYSQLLLFSWPPALTCSPPCWALQKAHPEVAITHRLNRMGRACVKVS